ncbi:acetyl-CoA carboxylase biotin carboxyl carrier protein [Amphibiibacter pelophylacis]|uniref:Acetyl-CoA carboxylase biotin carboxyl carrier protein n=1 Tax=Amphibiibacter pelophylacis TaxID=1799477 RepID=A0ACC6P3M1_9BURK
MDLRKLKTLIDLVSESGISELEITEAEGKVRIVKSSPVAAAPAPMMVAAAPAAPVAAAVSPSEAPSSVSLADSPVSVPIITGHIIKSPMVGTFYRAGSPGAPPMVQVGSGVKLGEGVCIIEAMKIMNEIESEFTGTIKQVLVENGEAVEYGQPLFVVE